MDNRMLKGRFPGPTLNLKLVASKHTDVLRAIQSNSSYLKWCGT